jgi:hypothetical protein
MVGDALSLANCGREGCCAICFCLLPTKFNNALENKFSLSPIIGCMHLILKMWTSKVHEHRRLDERGKHSLPNTCKDYGMCMTAKGVQHESYAKQKLTVRENSKLCDKFDKIYLS